jgi:hypothetical protein
MLRKFHIPHTWPSIRNYVLPAGDDLSSIEARGRHLKCYV